jgi:hypothetical protein
MIIITSTAMLRRKILRFVFSRSLPVYRPAVKAFADQGRSNSAIDSASGAQIAHSNDTDNNRGDHPLVVILGWAGAQPRNLSRLNQFYTEEMGMATATLIIPFPVTAFGKDFLESELCILIERHYAWNRSDQPAQSSATAASTGGGDAHSSSVVGLESSPSSPMYVHIYSNNGTWAYAGLAQRPNFPRPRALLWDSAPHLFYEQLPMSQDAEIISRVGTSSLLKRPQYHHTLLSPVIKAAAMTFLLIQRVTRYALEPLGLHLIPDYLSYNHFLRDVSPAIPMHFVYSSGDHLCLQSKIEEFIGHLKQRGVPVTMSVFGDDVPHITAFFKKAEEYKDIIRHHFLNK